MTTNVFDRARRHYYAQNHIGWCSRPAHGKDGFLRKGQFKKASNMNYCLDFSIRVEDELLRLVAEREAEHPDQEVSVAEENALYDMAMAKIIESDGGRTMAHGNVRLGEIILLVDCDTRVPIDCLQLGALEMIESPEVAIIQHASGVMQVVHNLFENGITYFTNLIYTSIQFAVGNGDCAPFVGHNAFLRWKAVQSVSFQEDNTTKFWSDSHVSEDFDISLRLQIQKFVVRLASYHHGGFKEGVSLTVYDELARWEKYAYGCNELVFHPFYKWPYKGPFTRLFLRFLWSDIKITSKITILAYIFTYYAIAAALPLTLANYLMVGWIQDQIDQFYLASWKIFVGMLVVFNGLVSLLVPNFAQSAMLTISNSHPSPSLPSDIVLESRNSSPLSGKRSNGRLCSCYSSAGSPSTFPKPSSATSSPSRWNGPPRLKSSKPPVSSSV